LDNSLGGDLLPISTIQGQRQIEFENVGAPIHVSSLSKIGKQGKVLFK